MRIAANILALLVAVIHVAILILEMFLWDHSIGRGVFGMTAELSAATAVLAANQGLYNGFLAAGLFYGLLTKKMDFVIFFLICVIVAGIYGATTAGGTILIVQAMPAALALVVTLIARKQR